MKKRWSRYSLLFWTFAFTCLIASTSTRAEDIAKSAIEKWRPKNGIYAVTGKDFTERCENLGDFSVELGENTITGDEWSCDLKKITDTGFGAIRLGLNCSDVNLEAGIPKPSPDSGEMRFEETMTFRKIDEKSLFIRKSQNGKSNFPETRVAYCPPKAQRAYLESKAKINANAAQRTAAERTAWRPHDGVYARAGADFNERCMTASDTIIDLAAASALSGGSICHVSNVTITPPDTVSLVCDQKPRSPGSAMKNRAIEPPGAETMIVSKIDDQSVLLRKFKNGKFTEFGQQLSYCPEAVQRSYAESRKTK
jgi:hypothetical protein